MLMLEPFVLLLTIKSSTCGPFGPARREPNKNAIYLPLILITAFISSCDRCGPLFQGAFPFLYIANSWKRKAAVYSTPKRFVVNRLDNFVCERERVNDAEALVRRSGIQSRHNTYMTWNRRHLQSENVTDLHVGYRLFNKQPLTFRMDESVGRLCGVVRIVCSTNGISRAVFDA